ncbi:energy transducer TonB [Solimonas terrae]|uniref:Energy transducer TonB n=1 Tax=Solimonas terrae TaxID=1396819 RepID=A0A6M2BMR1_9GAMM|nr:energy transducer TonB [Solimonas terrae]NGY03521.1 energy transducer TonB [Solimonas terrae]
MKLSVRVLILSLLLALCSCATPYQKQGILNLAGGGFGEKAITDHKYWVYFNGNGYAQKEHVLNLWLYRCAELTLEKGFQYLVIHPGEKPPAQSSSIDSQWRWTPAVATPGEAPAIRRDAALHGAAPVTAMPVRGGGYSYYYVPGTTIQTWNASGTVDMYQAPLPDDVLWAMDARRVIASLQAYKDSNGAQPAPSMSDVALGAFVAHEQIDFPVAPFPTFRNVAHMQPQPPSFDSLTAWDSADILTGIRERALITLHAMFRARRTIENLSNGGSITLSFTVDQFGWVTDCRIVSSSFSDAAFVEAVRRYFEKIKIDSSQTIIDTDVPNFTLTFAPT